MFIRFVISCLIYVVCFLNETVSGSGTLSSCAQAPNNNMYMNNDKDTTTTTTTTTNDNHNNDDNDDNDEMILLPCVPGPSSPAPRGVWCKNI